MMLRLPTLALLATAGLPVSTAAQSREAAPRADTLRYAVLIAGRPSGVQRVWTAGDGTRHAHFEFNDRGRGPKTDERITLGPTGLPTAIEISGNDYFKNAVDEHFAADGRVARWRSAAERGEAPAAGAFYTGFDGTPEELAALARALLAAPARRLALLPAGEARIERVAERTVRAAGEARPLTQYAISGIAFTPAFVWLDAGRNLFALGSTWQMVIREGWEAVAPELVKAQEAADAARSSALARTLARRPAAPLVFMHARLFDAESATMRPGTTVVVTGNRVTAVGADGAVAIPKGAEMIDATGRTVMPGLWDMHVHVNDEDGMFHIAAGVTTVRDMANDTEELIARRRKFADGTLIGPRVLMAGFIDGPGPYAGPSKVLVEDADSARRVVDSYARLGYEQIKVYSSLKPELLAPIVEEAHRKGMRVSGHVPAFMTAEQMIRAGVDEIQHENFLFLNFWGDSVKDTRTPLRFSAVAERAAGLDLGSPRVRDFLRLMKERRVVSDPTVNIFESLFTARKGEIDPSFASVADRMPPQVRRGFLGGGLPVPDGMDRRYRDSFRAMLALLKLMHDEGIRIVAGTDAFPGFALYRELELYSEAGIPNGEVLQLATLGAARVMKHDRELGSIAPGKLADLIVIDGDPTVRMSDIRRTELVVKDGVVYRPNELYRAEGVRPAPGTASGDGAAGKECRHASKAKPARAASLSPVGYCAPSGESGRAP